MIFQILLFSFNVELSASSAFNSSSICLISFLFFFLFVIHLFVRCNPGYSLTGFIWFNHLKQPTEVFLKISQNSQENICARFFFNKVAGVRLAPQNTSEWLLLNFLSLKLWTYLEDLFGKSFWFNFNQKSSSLCFFTCMVQILMLYGLNPHVVWYSSFLLLFHRLFVILSNLFRLLLQQGAQLIRT